MDSFSRWRDLDDDLPQCKFCVMFTLLKQILGGIYVEREALGNHLLNAVHATVSYLLMICHYCEFTEINLVLSVVEVDYYGTSHAMGFVIGVALI